MKQTKMFKNIDAHRRYTRSSQFIYLKMVQSFSSLTTTLLSPVWVILHGLPKNALMSQTATFCFDSPNCWTKPECFFVAHRISNHTGKFTSPRWLQRMT